ncbi:TrkA family potassium uptake protein [Candidatus Cryosericum hinesii]|jgi:trk system potassium uptake protein TrkA|uniref:Trk system potassium uptake protein TrkA n=2 Tax=Candidatus Cryosericum hinesii TaxID=2290915 RepID=A0A398DFS5_9BACT|nr:TrkA family potassium uptake protein [Candidatus Cryosericum hinesii]RIE14486.1 TrkA family potassium uptake protein [Candidatus Cryosericum hinesii]RIE14806.1 TrkA family potassium uptake protein [Candidatus Cryosericum hinesii]
MFVMYIIIVGCGRLGAQLATKLSEEGHDVAVVDRNPGNFSRLSDEFNGATVTGVGFDIEVLKSAGIEHADGFAAVTDGDNMNIMAAQVAKTIFKVPMVIARVFDPVKGETYRALGLETVCPTTSAANIIYSKFMIRNEESHFILPGGGIELVEVPFHPGIPATTIAEIEALDDFKVISLTRDGTTTFPKGTDVLADNDQLLVALHVSDLPRVSAIFHLNER